MNNKLIEVINLNKTAKRKVFVGCLTAGYPDYASTIELSKVMADNGVDIIELCVPFSDPMADGPTIQYSSFKALEKGATFTKTLDAVREIDKSCGLPIILMSYLNPLMAHGLENSFSQARKNGVSGFIIPDTILEESIEIREIAKKYELSIIPLTAPNSVSERLREIDKTVTSFAYIVSITGVTGARKELPEDIKEYLVRTKINMRSTRIIGFGISSPENVKQVKGYVDGIIVASAIINIIKDNTDKKVRNKKVADFIKSIRNALDKN